MGLTFKKEDNLERVFEELGIELPELDKDKSKVKNTLENTTVTNSKKAQAEKE